MVPTMNEADASGRLPGRRSSLVFFVLVFVLSVPFWRIGAVTRLELLPGLPISGLMVVCPLIAAAGLVYREDKAAGLMVWLERSLDCSRISPILWYLPILFVMPGVMVVS